MLFSFGEGEYFRGSQRFGGQIILGEHKLYLKGPQGELPLTFIPLEKIVRMRRTLAGLEFYVRASMLESYAVLIKGQRRLLSELIKELSARRGLKKQFLRAEWVDRDS